MNNNKIDSYSILIISKYFKTKEDYINVMCVNSKFKETTEKLRYNPISITSMKLFPKIQTQYLYAKSDVMIKGLDKYEVWHEVNYQQYLKYKEDNIKCHHIKMTTLDMIEEDELIPYGVTSLDDQLFYQRNIQAINIPNSVTSLGTYCFYYCYTIKDVILPNSLTSINVGCFSRCNSLTSINIPSSIQTICACCFGDCRDLQTIIIPNSVTSIEHSCFYNCISLQSIEIPSTITMLPSELFKYCSLLTNIVLPLKLTSIGDQCFLIVNNSKQSHYLIHYCTLEKKVLHYVEFNQLKYQKQFNQLDIHVL